jgi:hypothetical protein
MNKILLVYEDYAELMALEATLKKLAFNVTGISSEYSIAQQILSFNPDLVIGAGKGTKVNSLSIGKRLKEMSRWQGKSILIFPQNVKPVPQDLIKIRVDMILEHPVPTARLIQVMAKLLGHDEVALLAKFNKAATVAEGKDPKASGSGSAGSGGKFTTDDEPIYVRGSTDGTSGDGDAGGPGHSFDLRENRDEEDDASGENFNKKHLFRFGQKTTAQDLTEEKSVEENTGFADVDLKSLENEILGGGVPETEKIDDAALVAGFTEPNETVVVPNDTAAEEESPTPQFPLQPEEAPEESALEAPVSAEEAEAQALQAKLQAQLENAAKDLHKRVAKYSEMTAGMQVASKSTMTRIETRKRQRDIAADWDRQNLGNQDELRREFAKALFKK